MLELLQYKFVIHALLAALLTSISCGIIGSYIVARRMVFIGGGISHASFGGIGLGVYLGLDPVLCACGFSIVAASTIQVASRKVKIKEDSMIGILWAFGMALGIIFIHLTPGYVPNLMSYLFGSILTVSGRDLYFMAGLSLVIAVIFVSFFKEIVFIAFDEEFALSRQLPVQTINTLLICLISVTIVLTIKVVGIILVISLLTIPQACARIFSRNFATIILISIGLSFIATIVGLLGSYYLRIPSGACIIFASIIIYCVLALGKYLWNLRMCIGHTKE